MNIFMPHERLICEVGAEPAEALITLEHTCILGTTPTNRTLWIWRMYSDAISHRGVKQDRA